MKTKNIFIAITTTILLFSCGSDDEAPVPSDDDMGTTLEEERALTIADLTGGDEKLWKIETAMLTNTNGTFDIGNRYNMTDDEFLFSGDANNGNLVWRPGYDINLAAGNANDTAIDYYLEPQSYTFTFNTDSSDDMTSIDGQFAFTVVDDQNITGTITFAGRSSEGETLEVTLSPKTTIDFNTPPANGLNFQEVTSMDITEDSATIFSEASAGIIGSYSDNSLFVVARGLDPNSVTSEIIYKYNLNTQNWTTNYYNQQQFVTKRLNIINNELVAFGGQIVSTYPLAPSGAPTSEFQHDLGYTRFGFAVQGDFGYVVEGSTEASPLPPSKILKYNYLNNSFSEVGQLPKARLYGGTEIVNDNLYVFGGRNEFIGEELDAESFVYDLQNNTVSSFMMPEAPRWSLAAKISNLIYVGYVVTDQNDQARIKFGVYDTATNTFSTINDNLDDSSGVHVIEGITIFDGFLYVIYGSGQDDIMRIFRAPI